jgi:prepilin-type processing-associated H-X9-DG protein
LALANYHDSAKMFPQAYFYGQGFVGAYGNQSTEWRGFSAQVMLLPQMDQSPLYNQFNFSVGDSSAAPNSTAANNIVPVFRCPSDPVSYTSNGFGRSLINYACMTGSNVGQSNRYQITLSDEDGVFCRRVNVGFQGITDGSSNTISMAEQVVGGQAGSGQGFLARSRCNCVSLPGGWLASRNTKATTDALGAAALAQINNTGCFANADSDGTTGQRWQASGNGSTNVSSIWTPNSPYPMNHTNCTACFFDAFSAATARSTHTGGVHVLMADGAVRFVSENIDYNTWQALCVRNDGAVVGDF